MDTQILVTIICSVFASTGFWAFVTTMIQRKDATKNAQTKMLLGLAHDRICFLAESYIKEGFISKEDYENLHDYLFTPYKALKGNGTAEKLMKEVDKLPIKDKE